jgi:hypothetical protein
LEEVPMLFVLKFIWDPEKVSWFVPLLFYGIDDLKFIPVLDKNYFFPLVYYLLDRPGWLILLKDPIVHTPCCRSCPI